MTLDKIIEFAKEKGYYNVEYIGKWKEYDVYEPLFNGDNVFIVGPPLIILVNDNTMRMSTPEEAYDQLDSIA